MRQILFDFGSYDIFGHHVGLRVFGYGLMLVLGFLTAIAFAQWRARRSGESAEAIAQCGIVALILGVVGARLAFVIEQWDSFKHAANPLGAMLDITSGGLIYYGGLILAAAGVVGYLKLKRLPLRRYLDIVAASLMIGLAFGRMGCFLNGCCYGAQCDQHFAMAQQFPMYSQPLVKVGREAAPFSPSTDSPSPPYVHQMDKGQIRPDDRLTVLGSAGALHPPRDLHGPLAYDQVEPLLWTSQQFHDAFEAMAGADGKISKAEWQKAGATPNGLLRGSEYWSEAILHDTSRDGQLSEAEVAAYFQLRRAWLLGQFDVQGELTDAHRQAMNEYLQADLLSLAAAEHAHPVKPAQLLGMANALLIAVLLTVFYRFRTREGQVMALMMVLYPLGRFMLELIRDDNPHSLTQAVLTHNQWTSIATLLAGVGLFALLHRLPPSAGPVLAERLAQAGGALNRNAHGKLKRKRS